MELLLRSTMPIQYVEAQHQHLVKKTILSLVLNNKFYKYVYIKSSDCPSVA